MRILRLIYPLRCLCCGECLPVSTKRGVCTSCLSKTEPPNKKAVAVSYKGNEKILSCISPLYYKGNIKDSMLRYKFKSSPYLADSFALEMSYSFMRVQASEHFDIVCYVPISKGRLKQRGFDQSKRLAKYFSGYVGLPMKTLLEKYKENEIQHKLPAAKRRTNVLGVYRSVNKKYITGKRIILCDDIITTGSTLSECAKVLLENGARDVLCVTATQAIWE